MYCVPTSTRLTTPPGKGRGSQHGSQTLDACHNPLGEEIYAGDRTQRGPRRDRMRPRGFGGGPAGFDPTELDFAAPARGLATTNYSNVARRRIHMYGR